MIDEVVLYIVSCAPSLASIITCIVFTVRVLAEIKKIKDTVAQQREYEELKGMFKRTIEENYELKQLNKELLEKLDGIKRTNEESKE